MLEELESKDIVKISKNDQVHITMKIQKQKENGDDGT